MTERSNPLMNRPRSGGQPVSINGYSVSTDIREHCAWLNSLAWCQGQWSVQMHGDRLTVVRGNAA